MQATKLFHKFVADAINERLKTVEPYKIRVGKDLSLITKYGSSEVLVYWPDSESCHEAEFSTYSDFLSEIEYDFNNLKLKRSWSKFYKDNNFINLEEYWTNAVEVCSKWKVLTPDLPEYALIEKQSEETVDFYGWADGKAYDGEGNGDICYMIQNDVYHTAKYDSNVRGMVWVEHFSKPEMKCMLTDDAQFFMLRAIINTQTKTFKLKTVKRIKTL